MTNEGKLIESKTNITIIIIIILIYTDTNTHTHIEWNEKLKYPKRRASDGVTRIVFIRMMKMIIINIHTD